MGVLDVVHGVMALFSAVVILVARANERALDKTLDQIAIGAFNLTATEAAEQVAVFNHGIDALAARAVPFVLLSALCFFWVGHMGLKAARATPPPRASTTTSRS